MIDGVRLAAVRDASLANSYHRTYRDDPQGRSFSPARVERSGTHMHCPYRQDFPDSQANVPGFLTACRGCPMVVGNRMESIATFNWSIANHFAIVGDARVRYRTVPLAAPRRMDRERHGPVAGPTTMGRRVR
ncbi:hypothetical protein [Burkholderia metallica]|uniref:hypothetical protein n=1 Tax=Burkholderia metallica TaxID=488729 RepID=UPI001CF55538|nr:hypothetical protein [Burkholderia metallica]MCA8000558.1 hypothetical protein [Burkholderia metallica]